MNKQKIQCCAGKHDIVYQESPSAYLVTSFVGQCNTCERRFLKTKDGEVFQVMRSKREGAIYIEDLRYLGSENDKTEIKMRQW